MSKENQSLDKKVEGIIADFLEDNQDLVMEHGEAFVKSLVFRRAWSSFRIPRIRSNASMKEHALHAEAIADKARCFKLAAREYEIDMKRADAFNASITNTARSVIEAALSGLVKAAIDGLRKD